MGVPRRRQWGCLEEGDGGAWKKAMGMPGRRRWGYLEEGDGDTWKKVVGLPGRRQWGCLEEGNCNEASEGQGHAGSGDQTGPNKATLKLPDYDRSFE